MPSARCATWFRSSTRSITAPQTLHCNWDAPPAKPAKKKKKNTASAPSAFRLPISISPTSQPSFLETLGLGLKGVGVHVSSSGLMVGGIVRGMWCISATRFPSAATVTVGPLHSSLLQALATTASRVDSTNAIRLISGRSDLGVLVREVAKPFVVEVFATTARRLIVARNHTS